MQSIIETRAVKEGQFLKGCFVFELKHPIEGKNYGVINYETKGRSKLYRMQLTTGNCLSIEATYKIGPDAIMITEIL